MPANKELMLTLKIDPNRIREPAPLHEKTVLIAESQNAGIVVARARGFEKIGHTLKTRLTHHRGAKLQLLNETDFDRVEQLNRNIIAVGHAGNNELLQRMHHLGHLKNSDYPDRGLKLVSIHNPLGDGHNVIAALGYTTQAAGNSAERLIKFVNKNNGRWLINGRLFEVEPTPQGPELTDFLAKLSNKSESSRSLRPFGFLKALEHLNATGREDWARAFIELVKPYAIGQIPLSFELMSAVDFWTDRLVIGWDSAEEFDFFSDSERLMIVNFITSCTQYCNDSLTFQKWRITEQEHPIFNHHTFPAKGLYFGSMYLRRHGYQLPEIDNWLEKSDRVFQRAAQAGRAFDESGSVYSFLVGNALLQVSLAKGDTSYAKSDQLTRYANLAVVCQNNFFESVPFGDCYNYHGKNNLASIMLLQTAYWQNKPDCKFIAQKCHPELAENDILSRSIKPKKTDKYLGLFVLGLDSVIYRWLGLPMFPDYPEPLRKPNVPVEKCFDKITLRSGWNETDDYLLLQGLGGGTHSHPHTNSISQYQANARLFLLEADYIRRMPKNHNMVMVIRDGGHCPVPVTARLDAASQLCDSAVTQSTLLDYNGCDWCRTIIWLEQDCTVVIDSLKAKAKGDYELRCYWRTLGDAEQTTSGMHTEHTGQHFHIIELTDSNRHLEIETPPPDIEKYPEYRFGKNIPSVLCEKQKLHLDAGQETCFVNLLLPNARRKDPGRKINSSGLGKISITGNGPDITIDPDGFIIDGKADYKFTPENRLTALKTRIKNDYSPRIISAPAAEQKWHIQLPGRAVTVCSIDDTGFLLGCEDGSLLKADTKGNSKTIGKADGKINSVLAGRIYGENEVTLIAAGEDCKVRFFSEAGKERMIVGLVTKNYRWPASGRALCFADLDGDGNLWPIVGTRDWGVHAICPDGTFRWTFLTCAHGVTALSAGDLNNDGRDEIAAGTEYFCVPAITADGLRLWQDEDYNDYWQAGPIFPYIEIRDVDRDGKAEVLATGHDTLLHCISNIGEKKWTYSFGDEPAGMVILDDTIAVASATGSLHLIDGKGKRRWKLILPEPCTALSRSGEGLCVGLVTGHVFWVNKKGEITAQANLSAASCLLNGFDQQVLIADGRTGLSMWSSC